MSARVGVGAPGEHREAFAEAIVWAFVERARAIDIAPGSNAGRCEAIVSAFVERP